MRTYHRDGTLPQHGEIFVFGSNLAGRHGAGAARVACSEYGFPMFENSGLRGQAYAIPTKHRDVRTPLTLAEIRPGVSGFIVFARLRVLSTRFFVTSIGCGYAGYAPREIAPMFFGAPGNCSFPDTWKPHFGD